MKNTISRRDVLATSAAATAALAITGTPALAACSLDHKKMAYRFGTIVVAPNLTINAKAQLLARAKCPSCGTAIEPEGLSYGEHMQK